MKKLLLFILLFGVFHFVHGQGTTRYTYHDAAKKNLKEFYQVKDTISNILHGRYISYFLNGNIESKGQFVNNETTGVWEFYYETGNLKMRGIVRQNSNYGLWEYFFENGVKSMEGTISGKFKEGQWKIYYESGDLKESGGYVANKREGPWKTFFEDGKTKGEINYKDDQGVYTEFYHSGKVMAEGPKAGTRNQGHWKYYSEENGLLTMEGDFINGKKEGEWKFYYASGKLSSSGNYENDEPSGKWNYYFEDGSVSSSGEYLGGKRNGYWSTYNKNGSVKSEVRFNSGSGEYREFYPDKRLKVKGQIVDGKNQGKWEYFYVDGKLEGECEFDKGKGLYTGYFHSGALQTRGMIEDDLRVGTWELYEEDGKLSGYYKPIYRDNVMANEITSLANKSKVTSARESKNQQRGFYYFMPRLREYKGVIVEANPAMVFLGSIPFGVEFYNEERLGHSFNLEAIRDPFFYADPDVPQGKLFLRGYTFSTRQKFYNPMRTGMWYFAHEIRFTSQGHYANVFVPQSPNALITASANEKKLEYGLLLGVRLMQNNDGDGFAIDAFVGYGGGYRKFSVDEEMYGDVFSSISRHKFSQTFHFGITFGRAFSLDGRGR